MQKNLKKQIELLRRELNRLLEAEVQHKEKILEVSRELDKLIEEYYLQQEYHHNSSTTF
jgi:DNA primase large subunit